MTGAGFSGNVNVNAVGVFLYLTDEADQWSFAQSATTAPTAEKAAADIPNHMKRSQVIISVIVRIPSSRASDEKQEGTGDHHYHSGQGAISPRLPDNLYDTVITSVNIIS